MSPQTRPRRNWLTYAGFTVVAILVLAATHFAINGNLIGWIAALHGG